MLGIDWYNKGLACCALQKSWKDPVTHLHGRVAHHSFVLTWNDKIGLYLWYWSPEKTRFLSFLENPDSTRPTKIRHNFRKLSFFFYCNFGENWILYLVKLAAIFKVRLWELVLRWNFFILEATIAMDEVKFCHNHPSCAIWFENELKRIPSGYQSALKTIRFWLSNVKLKYDGLLYSQGGRRCIQIHTQAYWNRITWSNCTWRSKT